MYKFKRWLDLKKNKKKYWWMPTNANIVSLLHRVDPGISEKGGGSYLNIAGRCEA